MRKVIAILAVLCSLFVLGYFFPFSLRIDVVNEKGDAVNSNIEVYWNNNRVRSVFGNNTKFLLPSGEYEIKVSSYGYQNESALLMNRLVSYKAVSEQRIELSPKKVDLDVGYYEPTGTVRLLPSITVEGVTIQGEQVNASFSKPPVLDFGFYAVRAETEDFLEDFLIEGDDIGARYLEPKNAIFLSLEEFSFVKNFYRDYLDMQDAIDLNFKGHPKQYYLYYQDEVLSLGDMLLLLAEEEAYIKSGLEPVYFVLKGKEYSYGGEDYGDMLDGKAYVDSELNQRLRKSDIAFSYDIESGRYVHQETGISPCSDPVFLRHAENPVCADADINPWFSEIVGDETGWPWVSGLSGIDLILDISEDYGIPATFYMVGYEVSVYEELEPDIVDRIQRLVDSGFIEIGSHTYHHSLLGKDIDRDKEEANASRKFLEEKFETDVVGFRGPYLSLIGDDVEVNAEVLGSLGYEYASNEDSYSGEGAEGKPIRAYTLAHAPGSFLVQLGWWYDDIIVLDHPWNMYYSEIEVDDQIKLIKNSRSAELYKAKVLASVSYGFVPSLVRDI